MNIRNLLGLNNIMSGVSATNSIQKADRQIKSDNTNDRDANGQMLYQKQKKKEKMTPEQFEKALALLNQKSFMKDMNWMAIEFLENEVRYAEVRDSNGEVIRRLSEYDMWELFDDVSVDQNKGNLLKRTA